MYTCNGARDNKGNILQMKTEGWVFGAWLDTPEILNIPDGELTPVPKPALFTSDADIVSQYTYNYSFGSITLIETHELIWTEGYEPSDNMPSPFTPLRKAYIEWNGQYFLVDMKADYDPYNTILPDTICPYCYKPTDTKNGLYVRYGYKSGYETNSCKTYSQFYISVQDGKLMKTSMRNWTDAPTEYSGSSGGLMKIDGQNVAYYESFGNYTLYYLNEGVPETKKAISPENSELYNEADLNSSKNRIKGKSNLCLIITDGGIVTTDEDVYSARHMGYTDRIHWYYVHTIESGIEGWAYMWEYRIY